MKTLDRRDFLKKATLAGASALTVLCLNLVLQKLVPVQ